ncbi:hypothetical protein ACFXHA_05105 [Nocardia sp. NPDC059240]|uniref:hypothetical protein n=1 Tax=Nocardia sp. NPDC059240 TaxID=3346786 RepID=UPI0036AAF7D8
MNRIMKKAAIVLTVAAAAPVVLSATATADTPGTVYFSSGSWNCSIAADGTTGCDLSGTVPLQLTIAGATLPLLIPTREVVIDVPWLPAHPGFDAGTPHTLPGGNPILDSVATSQDTWGPRITYGGASCASGFHGSFTCSAKGHSFTYYEVIAAN